MNEQDWSLLDFVYREQNLSRAAEQLFLSQPTLTYRLHQIESEFGIKIFTRTGKTMKFTPEGEHLVAYARNMLLELRKTKDLLTNLKHQDIRSTIRIGVSGNYAMYRMVPILHSFYEQFPNIQVNMLTSLSSVIFQLLQMQDVHVCIVRGEYSWFDRKDLLEPEGVCLVSKQPIRLEELPSIPCIQYRNDPNAAGLKHKTDPLLGKAIDSWWNERFNESPLIAMQVDNLDMTMKWVKMGVGYSIVPEVCLTDEDRTELFVQPLEFSNGQAVIRNNWMLYRESSLGLYAVDKFVEHVRTWYRNRTEES
ncbi:LysR family transcriptional regulator [Cohnella sp. CFH 77786]|uniref:LysR family transcriptional regulator n=1 Tax=Cohnella sp. CFH 77786 TaxID=2662265 RepID=UPI001C610A71|nr:LysR family transcriptional regulator [Cohnella sp. CFH 77786]MBW5445295.1 LysR family transcriptional regulator [Cohnella sp. CFH 77786]